MKDQNSASTLYGVSDADGTTPIQLEIDPVTGRLLMEIAIVANHSSALSGPSAVKDSNSVATLLCQNDDSSGNLVPEIDRVNSQLFVDIIIE